MGRRPILAALRREPTSASLATQHQHGQLCKLFLLRPLRRKQRDPFCQHLHHLQRGAVVLMPGHQGAV